MMTRLMALLAIASLLAGCGGKNVLDTSGDLELPPVPEVNIPEIDPDFPGFPENDPKVVKLESGLEYKEVVEGIAHRKEAKEGDRVRVHYAGWLTSGKRFDCSWKAGTEPTTFTLKEGPGGVIKGFIQGISGMREGGRRLIRVPGELGYGSGGNPDAGIDPDATLIFEVFLFEVLK